MLFYDENLPFFKRHITYSRSLDMCMKLSTPTTLCQIIPKQFQKQIFLLALKFVSMCSEGQHHSSKIRSLYSVGLFTHSEEEGLFKCSRMNGNNALKVNTHNIERKNVTKSIINRSAHASSCSSSSVRVKSNGQQKFLKRNCL